MCEGCGILFNGFLERMEQIRYRLSSACMIIGVPQAYSCYRLIRSIPSENPLKGDSPLLFRSEACADNPDRRAYLVITHKNDRTVSGDWSLGARRKMLEIRNQKSDLPFPLRDSHLRNLQSLISNLTYSG